jgi:hypothetical protein
MRASRFVVTQPEESAPGCKKRPHAFGMTTPLSTGARPLERRGIAPSYRGPASGHSVRPAPTVDGSIAF